MALLPSTAHCHYIRHLQNTDTLIPAKFSIHAIEIARIEQEAILKAVEELISESLPLQSGSRLYKLEGLKPLSWYEVKISYPASIPASFSIQLKKGDMEMNLNRRLMNTEKLIFKNENLEQEGTFVMVTVEPEGVVAIKHVPERQSIIFNLVCNELLLGIPHQAWWVGILVLLCLVVAFIIPLYLPSYLLPRNPDAAVTKDS